MKSAAEIKTTTILNISRKVKVIPVNISYCQVSISLEPVKILYTYTIYQKCLET